MHAVGIQSGFARGLRATIKIDIEKIEGFRMEN